MAPKEPEGAGRCPRNVQPLEIVWKQNTQVEKGSGEGRITNVLQDYVPKSHEPLIFVSRMMSNNAMTCCSH